MIMKFLFITFRGLSRFKKYFKSNLFSMLALIGLFLMLHVAFALSSGVAQFANSVARFDKVRVFVSSDSVIAVEELQKKLADMPEVMDIRKSSATETKQYLLQNAPTISGISDLPAGFFPLFFELTIHSEYRNPAALADIASKVSTLDNVKSVFYGKEWAYQMENTKRSVDSLLSLGVVLFIIAGAVIVYQAVGLVLYRFKNEIQIYNIVGGTKSFIVLPFVVMSFFIGVLCTLISFLLYYGIHYIYIRGVQATVGLELNLTWDYLLMFCISVAFISPLSGYISASRYLKKASSVNER